MEQNEETAALCITESRVQVDRGFRNSLWQQVVADEEYGAIVDQLQDPAEPKEISDQWKNKYRIKQGVLKIHQEDQNKMYQYWRTVIPDHHQIKMQVLKEIHCVPYSGHPGYVRTLDLAKQHFYWKQMSQDERDFVIHCPVCQTEKSSHQKPIGMLMSLELPERKWDHVAIDFVTGLPEEDGMNTICTVVDKATKCVISSPVPTRLQHRRLPNCIGNMSVGFTAFPVLLFQIEIPDLQANTGVSCGVCSGQA